MGDYKAAASAYRRGLEKDPTNANLKTGLQNAEARIVPEDDDDDDDDGPPPLVPDTGSSTGPGMADMLRGFGGGGAPGAGGMPDMAGLLNNPMMAQMAQQMMANGGMTRMMQNPAVANMVCCPAYTDTSFLMPVYPAKQGPVWRVYANHGGDHGRSKPQRYVSYFPVIDSPLDIDLIRANQFAAGKN